MISLLLLLLAAILPCDPRLGDFVYDPPPASQPTVERLAEYLRVLTWHHEDDWTPYEQIKEVSPWFAFGSPPLKSEWEEFQIIRNLPYDIKVTAKIQEREVSFQTSSRHDPRFVAMVNRLFWYCRVNDSIRHEMCRDLLSHCLGQPAAPDCEAADADLDGDVDMDDVGRWQLWE